MEIKFFKFFGIRKSQKRKGKAEEEGKDSRERARKGSRRTERLKRKGKAEKKGMR